MKRTSRKPSFVVAVILVALLGSLSSARADDCSRAKEYYAKGTKLLNYEERRAAFQRAVEMCPSYAEAHNNLADALENLAGIGRGRNLDEKSISQGNALLEQAVKHYQKALELNRYLYQANIGLGEIYLGQGRYEPAADEFKSALDRDPGNERAKLGLEEARRCMARDESQGLKKSNDIITRVKDAPHGTAGRLMGVENHTVRDRESFNNILFAGWSAQVAPGEPTEQLNEIGIAMASPDLKDFSFVIEGHTNTVGGFEENMKLSWDRARSVKSYLVEKCRIDPSRLVVQGHGYTKTKVRPENAPANRRVEVVFLQQKAGR